MQKTLIILLMSFISIKVVAEIKLPIYLDDSQPIENRIEDALKYMTLQEKINMCHAQSKFSSPGVPRLGIPGLWCDDGPHGVKAEILWNSWDYANCTNDSCTAFPSLTCLAATWNPEMAYLYGKSLGEEFRYRNKNIVLGPTINIYRTPLAGRNFESMGEDPYLTSQMVVPYIKGVQSNGVGTCVKHFAVNNQEADRLQVNVHISDRALEEIYLPAFKAAVTKGDTWAIMGAYNKYENQFCSYNPRLVQQILKGDWGFKGVVMSDWGGTHHTVEAANGGLDIEMGTDDFYHTFFFSTPLLQAVKDGKVSQQTIDDKVRRILRLILRTSMNRNRPYGSFASQEHANAARTIAQEGIVLLKNKDNLLPITAGKYKNILVVGDNATRMMSIGGGSSELKVNHEVTPLEGLLNRFGKESKVSYAQGYTSQYSGCQSRGDYLGETLKSAKNADFIIFVGGLNKQHGQDSEQSDRADMDLPYNQDKIISTLSSLDIPLVVILISGNAVTMPWVNKVPAILQAWYGGSEAGNALAAILSGDVNPSGKLPFSFPVNLTDNSAHSVKAGEYPGNGKDVVYKDDIFVGYRWLDKNNIKPLYGFGYGLSYTSFAMSNPTVSKKVITQNDSITFTIDVINTGKVKGAEVVQLYISDPKSSLVRPQKELKAFKKTYLNPNETQTVCFTIGKDALSFYDDTKKKWVAESGQFIARIGDSSQNIRYSIKFNLQ